MSTAARKARKRAGVQFYKEPKVKTAQPRRSSKRDVFDSMMSSIHGVYASWLGRGWGRR